jgi:hypothetical protein
MTNNKQTKKIIKDKPFNDFLEIKNIELLEGAGTISKNSFKIETNNNKFYKLRNYSLENAKKLNKI